jgi:hypothetical protein
MNNKVITFLLAAFLINTTHGALKEFNDAGYSFCRAESNNKDINSIILFNAHESFNYDYNSAFQNPLFVGASFQTNRSIDSFNHRKLMTVKDIAIFSQSKIDMVKNIRSGLSFRSTKTIKFQTLICHNTVKSYDWNTFNKMENYLAFSETLDRIGCLEDKIPSIVTVQKVYNCNLHFDRSTIVTFYTEVEDNITQVLSFSLNDLKTRPGALIRGVMKNEIRRSMLKFPSLLKEIE